MSWENTSIKAKPSNLLARQALLKSNHPKGSKKAKTLLLKERRRDLI
ncbi:hypothetical protein DB41_CT00070 [Neochlamydia sp. TUME1]|nr:hypothetical protein DB41_CT00070 [Neochlamydia sp. TUME1]